MAVLRSARVNKPRTSSSLCWIWLVMILSNYSLFVDFFFLTKISTKLKPDYKKNGDAVLVDGL